MTRTGAGDPGVMEVVTAHRRQLAAVLDGLSIDAWDRPSLCAGWQVRHVVAHMIMPFRYPAPRFLAEMARSRGNFDKMADRVARRDGAASPGDLLAVLRENEQTAWKPPGGGLTGALTHDVIHGQDITVALGIDYMIPEDLVRTVLATVTSGKSRKHFGVDLDGIELQASDIDWSFGSGTPLSAPAQDLALVLCGRKLAAGRLRGPASPRFSTDGLGTNAPGPS
jgi:uncharacterized protein (TIGR03083 family)